jgi:CBS domain containing-hemolysin-like protein
MWALVVARPIALAGTLLAPFVWPVGELVSRHASEIAFGSPIARPDEKQALVDAGEEEGLIEEDEREMIGGIFRLSDTKVREVMVPRIDMVAIAVDADLDTALDAILQAGHSRIPVYDDTLDNIRGLLYAKDLLRAFRARDFAPVLSLSLREPYFVPESKPVDQLLAELQSRKVHMAIVVDEYGGTAGLVTIEDLLEEIVGEIQDEYDVEEARFELLSEDEGVFQAGVDIDDVNRLMDVDLPTEDVDTLAGLVMTSLGRVPEVGDWARFEHADIEVQAVKGRRIERVRVLRKQAPGARPDEEGPPGIPPRPEPSGAVGG